MDILFIETFYAGSHRNFADRWISRSRHKHYLFTLPGRFWKWRQAGSALYLAEKIPESREMKFDAMVVSGMTDLAHLKTLRPDLPPAMLYIHENQFSYPLQAGEKRDFRYGLTDLVNILSAETVIFNSRYNRDSFLEECRKLFQRLPDALPGKALEKASVKSRVIHPGIDTEGIHRAAVESEDSSLPEQIPLIIWNHRHEHDKNPEEAFGILENLRNKRVPFRLALLGERFSRTPEAFTRARRVLSGNIVVDDFPPVNEYFRWLKKGDFVISTAVQENFGISVLEASAAGCWPLLPRRLAYPEVMPSWVQGACFWDTGEELEGKLKKLLGIEKKQRNRLTEPLSRWVSDYCWANQAEKLDNAAESVVSPGRNIPLPKN
jgi:glycosyltransferase involved in cell wall biosynthesis